LIARIDGGGFDGTLATGCADIGPSMLDEWHQEWHPLFRIIEPREGVAGSEE
jgi:hypothetical protein